MSNGHYTALVDINHVLYQALELIANNTVERLMLIPSAVACAALAQADEISNRNGITQSNEETNNARS